MSGADYLQLSKLKSLLSGDREPLMQWKWYVEEFPEIGGRRLPPPYAESVGLPLPSMSQNTREVAATTLHFPGSSSIDTFEMILYEDQSISSLSYIQDWQSLVQNPRTGGYRVPSIYWKNLQVKLLNNENGVAATALLRNVWPLGASPITLDNSPGSLKINAQFCCSACIIVPTKKLIF